METIVIVDDETSVLGALKRALRKLPYDIEYFSEPEKALEFIFKGGPIDVIITDYRMPDLDGIAFLKAVNKLNKPSMKIVMSGESDMNILQKAINEVGIFRFLSKPWDIEELKDAIEKAIEHQRRNIVTTHLADIGRKGSIATGSSADKWLSECDDDG